jgi:hypothetical protein
MNNNTRWRPVYGKAVYRTQAGDQILFPVIKIEGVLYLKSAKGEPTPYVEMFDDAKHGLLAFVKSVPEDHIAVAIAEIHTDLCRFSGADFTDFLKNDSEFERALASNFADLKFSRLLYFGKRVAEAWDWLKQARSIN